MRVLFLVWSSYPAERMYADPSVFYRCYHPVAALRAQGIYASVLHFETVSAATLTDYDYIIFFRPQLSDKFLALHEVAQEAGIPCIASYDDLFFDIEMLRQSNFRGLGAPQTQILASRPYNYAQAMYFFDTFIVSTDPLGRRLSDIFAESRVHVQYNAASEEMQALACLYTRLEPRIPRRIGYFAGGASHTPDLVEISPQLVRVLEDGDAEFFCVETVQVPAVVRETGRVVTTRRMTYVEMLRAYASCSVTIAPLHMNTFTASKSGIKCLESALVGAACVATPIPDVLRLADERLIRVDEAEGWYDGMMRALSLPVSEEIARDQQQRISEHFTTSIEARRLTDFLQNGTQGRKERI